MSRLEIGTHFISYDEPCLGLYEVNLQSPGSRGWHRYQVIYVVRNDRPAVFKLDLGPAAEARAQQFRIPGGVVDEVTGRMEIVHTVGELRDIADLLRGGKVPEPEFERRDMVQGYHDQIDARKLLARGRRSFIKEVA